ncbi:nitrous oxide reductase family maturation protein NosD [Pelobium manganitolerans]|uniref:nitrous oxide reductase family maturation protein NosD n=1 Tax=Pelobium manganitolerans TaxID=1842495 RepID=UPI003FA36CE6
MNKHWPAENKSTEMYLLRYIIYFTLSFFIVFGNAQAKTIVVKSGAKPASLREAIAMAQNGDTIVVQKGIYASHNTVVNKSLTILGKNRPVLDAQFKDEVLTVTASNVKIEGFVLRNSKTGDLRDYAGLRIFGASNVHVNDNILENNFFGIYISDSHRVSVTNNKVTGNNNRRQAGNGIQAWKSDHITITGNQVTAHRDGIYFEFVQNSHIKDNNSEKNLRYGLHFMFSNDNSYIHNQFKNNQAGVAVMYSKRIKMQYNQFNENWGSSIYGLLLKEILDSQIAHNTFYKNTSAIFMESCNRNKIYSNSFSNNGLALRVLSNCQDNNFTLNNFKGNTFDVTTNGDLLENHFAHNYWDKYEGYDLNKDGIGDVPFRPVSLYAQIMERIPQSVILMRSFIVNLLDKVERSIPSITPLSVKDDSPQMKPWKI